MTRQARSKLLRLSTLAKLLALQIRFSKRAVAKVLKGRSRHPNYQHERAHHRIMIVCHERHDHSSYTEDVPEPTESTGDHSGYPAALAAGRGSRVAPDSMRNVAIEILIQSGAMQVRLVNVPQIQ